MFEIDFSKTSLEVEPKLILFAWLYFVSCNYIKLGVCCLGMHGVGAASHQINTKNAFL